MGTSMIHWNGHQLCAIDTETTGLDPNYNEIIQICILPLDSNIKPRRDVFPFYIEIVPDHPERASLEAMEINRLDFAKIAQRGIDREKAKDLLGDWINKLGLPETRYGNSKKILPLGQNYAFDRSFMMAWLGNEQYREYFHYSYRDTKIAAAFVNDKAAMHAEKAPFSKTGLSWLAHKLNVVNERAHDALSDCVTTAEVYRKMCQSGLLV